MKRAALIGVAFWMSPVHAGDLAFVTCQNADEVAIVDLVSGKLQSQVKIEGAPAPVAYDPRAGLAYVISAETGRLSAIDEKGRVTWRANLGEGSFGVAVASDGGLFITHWYGAKLMRFDARMTLLWAVNTGKSPAGVAVNHDGTLVATADRDDNRVSIYDAVSGRRLRMVTTGKHPYAVTFHDGKLWTTDVQSDSVTVIDPIAGEVLATIPTGSHPYGIAFAGGKGFVTNQYDGSISVFDAKSHRVTDLIETGDYPEGISALPDGSGVAVVHWESNTLTTVDAKTLRVVHEIDLPDGPRAFGQFTGRQR